MALVPLCWGPSYLGVTHTCSVTQAVRHTQNPLLQHILSTKALPEAATSPLAET